MPELNETFLKQLQAVTAKRPQTVIAHILEHGYITSEDLSDTYGYKHPPRAIRDVREHGIPIERFSMEKDDGKKIHAYRFGAPEESKNPLAKSHGRTALVKTLKDALIEIHGEKCFIYLETMDASDLQVDHRIPYEIGGECDTSQPEHFMLLSPSANRTKSWTCEHCENWEKKDRDFCLHCFWAYPENYEHIAGKVEKVLTLRFSGEEIADYQKLVEQVGSANAQDWIKQLLHKHL